MLIEKLLGNNIEIPILLMLLLGLRMGEATGLRWSDVDLDNNLINVNQILVYSNGKISLKSQKHQNQKSFISSKELIEKLKIEKLRQSKLKLQGILENKNNLVCLNTNLNPFLPSSLRKTFHNFTKKII